MYHLVSFFAIGWLTDSHKLRGILVGVKHSVNQDVETVVSHWPQAPTHPLKDPGSQG